MQYPEDLSGAPQQKFLRPNSRFLHLLLYRLILSSSFLTQGAVAETLFKPTSTVIPSRSGHPLVRCLRRACPETWHHAGHTRNLVLAVIPAGKDASKCVQTLLCLPSLFDLLYTKPEGFSAQIAEHDNLFFRI